jgi:hypothetical protein
MNHGMSPDEADEIRLIGCCGAYCKTCPSLVENSCKGCKLGYDDGARDLTKARCKMKVCCLGQRKHETCTDCSDYACDILIEFQSKDGYKYHRYKESLEFIRENGYTEFIRRSWNWKRAYGKL